MGKVLPNLQRRRGVPDHFGRQPRASWAIATRLHRARALHRRPCPREPLGDGGLSKFPERTKIGRLVVTGNGIGHDRTDVDIG